MEFYTKRALKATRSVCFNSQRDGILQKQKLNEGVPFFEFQFPTGWNSTGRMANQDVAKHCFNSQRDGILHSFCAEREGRDWVSIPNGLEFYSLYRKIQ